MAHLLIKAKVKDNEKWKSIFKSDEENRRKHGSKGGSIFSSVEDKNELFILLEFGDLASLKSFLDSDELKEKIKESVAGPPTIHIIEKKFDTEV